MREGAAEVLGFDRRLIATLRDLLIRPARVVEAHLTGRGGAYVHPLKLFLSLGGLYMVCLAWLQPFSFSAVATDSGPYEVPLTEVILDARTPEELRLRFAEHGLTEQDANERFQERMNTTTPLIVAFSLVPLAMILGVIQRGRTLRDHLTFLLVISNAVWLASLLVLPVMLLGTGWGVAAMYAATYGYLAIGFLGVYRGPSRLGAAGRFVAFLFADVIVTSTLSMLLTAAILGTIFYP